MSLAYLAQARDGRGHESSLACREVSPREVHRGHVCQRLLVGAVEAADMVGFQELEGLAKLHDRLVAVAAVEDLAMEEDNRLD